MYLSSLVRSMLAVTDLMLGAVAIKGDALIQNIDKTQYALGYSVSADDAWLALMWEVDLSVAHGASG